MKTLAAILVATGRPLELADLEIPSLKPGQLLVELLFSGVCHTQVGEWLGWRGPDPYLPHCLGHEGCGRVLEVGPGVTRCKAGDAVLLSWIKASGLDVPGTAYRHADQIVNAGAVTTFSKHAVVSENRCTIMPSGIDSRTGALIGCAVATGFGSVVNAAKIEANQSVAVFGVGGIGLCAVAAAAVLGANPILAIDQRQSRLEIAREFGATETINASEGDVLDRLRQLRPGGWDVAIEATGQPEVMRTALSSVRARGGCAVVIGNAKFGDSLTLDPRELNQGKRLLGTWGGDTVPDRDFPKFCEWIVRGQTPIGKLLDHEYGLEQINDALADLHAGRCTRPLINLTM